MATAAMSVLLAAGFVTSTAQPAQAQASVAYTFDHPFVCNAFRATAEAAGASTTTCWNTYPGKWVTYVVW